MNPHHIVLFLLRISLGWLFLYAGITKVLDPTWTAAGYLKSATTFSAFFEWLASPGVLPLVNYLNEWGLTFLGVSLLFGVGIRLTAPVGALLMLLYYFSVLDFPYIGEHAFVVDEHIVYALVLLSLSVTHAGRYWGFEGKAPFFKRFFR